MKTSKKTIFTATIAFNPCATDRANGKKSFSSEWTIVAESIEAARVKAEEISVFVAGKYETAEVTNIRV